MQVSRQLDLFATAVAGTVDRLGLLIDIAMAGGALRKRLENEASDALDSIPFERPARGPWCADYGRQSGELAEQHRASLTSIGMRIDEHGRYWLTEPPAPEPDKRGTYDGYKAYVAAARP